MHKRPFSLWYSRNYEDIIKLYNSLEFNCDYKRFVNYLYINSK